MEENNSQVEVLSCKLKRGDVSDRWARMSASVPEMLQTLQVNQQRLREQRHGNVKSFRHIVPESLSNVLTFKLKLTFPASDTCSHANQQLFSRGWESGPALAPL